MLKNRRILKQPDVPRSEEYLPFRRQISLQFGGQSPHWGHCEKWHVMLRLFCALWFEKAHLRTKNGNTSLTKSIFYLLLQKGAPLE